MKLIVDGISKAAARRALKTWWVAPLVLLLVAYLRRVAIRFERLLARIDMGCAASRPSSASRLLGGARKTRLPDAFAWLRWMAPETAEFARQLKAMLAEPELAALLAQAPQSGTLLRPLLWMLGETAEDLPPPPPRRVRRRRAPSASPGIAQADPVPGFKLKPVW